MHTVQMTTTYVTHAHAHTNSHCFSNVVDRHSYAFLRLLSFESHRYIRLLIRIYVLPKSSQYMSWRSCPVMSCPVSHILLKIDWAVLTGGAKETSYAPSEAQAPSYAAPGEQSTSHFGHCPYGWYHTVNEMVRLRVIHMRRCMISTSCILRIWHLNVHIPW
jgi:hypothetical protein